MNITIELPDDLIASTITRFAAQSFATPSYRGERGGDSYEAIKRVVADHVASIDFGPMVREKVAEVMSKVVGDVLEDEIRRQAKARVKEMAKVGVLFDGVKTEERTDGRS